MQRLPKFFIPFAILVILVLMLLANTAVTIDSGQNGVIYRTFQNGVDTDKTLGEGFHIIAPWNKVIKYEVRQQEVFEQMKVLSSNGLEITLDVSSWYQPKKSELGKLHQNLGTTYLERVIKPAIRSAGRSVVGRYTPEQIYSSKRDAIQQEIFVETKKILDNQHVILVEVLVRDVTLPATIKDAIERKLGQEQESLEYEFRLQKAEKEAERQRIEAKGKADANKILSASLTDKILQDKGIDATLKLSESPNSKVVVVGGGDAGLPLILGDN